MVISISEFTPDSKGVKRNGCCTQASASMSLTWALALQDTYQHEVDLMSDMVSSMFARGECAQNGAATIVNMATEMKNRGGDIFLQVNYTADRTPYDWLNTLRLYAGVKPILLQVSNAEAFTPINPFSRGVKFHAIMIRDKQSNGYVVYDPNIASGTSQPVVYTRADLDNASPCGMIVLNVASKGDGMPDGYDIYNDGYLGPPSPKDNQRYVVRGGILTFIKGHLVEGMIPIEDIHLDTDGYYRQMFTNCCVRWKSSDDCAYDTIGWECLNLRHKIDIIRNDVG